MSSFAYEINEQTIELNREIIVNGEPIINNETTTINSGFLHEYGIFTMDFRLKQLDKGQDWAIINTHINEVGEEFAYGAVFDGHGPNPRLIETISNLDINTIMATESPCETAFKILENDPVILLNSGSTMNSVKMFAGRIECENVGDSTTIVILNGAIVYQNKCHNYLNDEEQVRLNNQGYSKPGVMPVVSANATVITLEPSPVFVFTNIIPYQLGRETELTLVPTQSIGHRGATGCAPDKMRIDYNPSIDEVICLIMSDGITDMMNFTENKNDIEYLMTHTCDEVISLSEARWKQSWMFEGRPTSFPKNGYDDLAFVQFIYKPNNVYKSSPSFHFL
jgi:serine/threonine protein phosphatase PrpC